MGSGKRHFLSEMLSFDPNDPFPKFPVDSLPYADEQRHSAQVDAWLGLHSEQIERHLSESLASAQDEEKWLGLSLQSLLTPYTEIRGLLGLLDPKPGSQLIDLGAGYGRLGFVMGRHYSEVRFLGYEIVRERVEESRRCLSRHAYPRVQMEIADLSAPLFNLADARYYFIYDYGSRRAIEKTLDDLRRIARQHSITVVGRGRCSRDAIERGQPWLSQVIPAEHHAHYSIYRSG